MSTKPIQITTGGQGNRKGILWSLLVVSVALNFWLAFAAWPSVNFPNPAQPQPLTGRVQAIAKFATNTVVVATAERTLDWRAVESEDYKKYIGNLRGIGCPEKTIRDIILADVNDLYHQRFLQAFPPTNRVEYWKPGDPLANVINETEIEKLQDFAKEKRELIAELLGSDSTVDVELASIQTKVFMEQLLNFLTPDKRDAMEELERKFTAKTLNTFKDTVRGDNQSAKDVLAEKNEEVLKILSPKEKFEYDLRRSDAAMLLRVGLGDFELSEQEFRDIFPPMQLYIANAGMPSFAAMVSGRGDARGETLAARQELLKSLKSVLSQQRYGEFMAGTGWNLNNE